MIRSNLHHDSVFRRAATLALLGVALHFAAWTAGYLLLPPEVLRDTVLSSKLPVVGDAVGSTLSRILVANLLLGFGLVALANLFRIRDFPLGYFLALAHWGMFGLFLGTGSFTVGDISAAAPSMTRFLAARGTWEILSYTLVAAATYDLFVFRQRRWLTLTAKRVRSFGEIRLTGRDWATIALAGLLLVAANWTEARSLMERRATAHDGSVSGTARTTP